MDVTVVCATYGDLAWRELALTRALPSAQALGVPTIHVHGETLHSARNACLRLVATEWVVHLDADDELEPGYLDHLATGTADVRVPSVRYLTNRRRQPAPYMPQVAGHTHTCSAECLTAGNWIVVGALAKTALLRGVGGWRDYPVYEDWDLWLRCHLAGASIEAIPAAVYRAYVRPDSRNRAPSMALKNNTHRAIARDNGLLEVAA